MNLFRLKDGNYSNQKSNGSALLLVALVLACFGLPQRVQATDLGGVLPGGNTADGFGVLTSLTTGAFNTGTGWSSLKTVSSGSFNTAFGAATLFANTGDRNTATGAAALLSNTTGVNNTATGSTALLNNTTGNHNTASGAGALLLNTTGSSNVAIGQTALVNNISGNFNIAVGSGAGTQITTAFSCIAIGHQGANVSQSCFIGNIRNAVVSPDAAPVLIDSAGKLGTTNGSSRRFKTQIKPMDKTSESILGLKPVTFCYTGDNTNTPQFGLIAEDVVEVNPDLTVRDKTGELVTVRYDEVNAMLLNEFLKEHRKVEELKSAIAQQQKTTEALIARLNEQEAQIQKVSGEVEARKAVLQMLVENR